MKSLHSYINERLTTNKDNILYVYYPKSRVELLNAIFDHFKYSDGNLNDIDVSKLKEKDFDHLFHDLRFEIEEKHITEINISKWELEELYCLKENGMFEKCETLKYIILPSKLKIIGNYTFYNCKNLNNIIIPDSVTSINSRAFYKCDKLTSLIIPDSVTSIDNYAFWCCSNMTITVPNEDIKTLVEDSGFDGKIIVK